MLWSRERERERDQELPPKWKSILAPRFQLLSVPQLTCTLYTRHTVSSFQWGVSKNVPVCRTQGKTRQNLDGFRLCKGSSRLGVVKFPQWERAIWVFHFHVVWLNYICFTLLNIICSLRLYLALHSWSCWFCLSQPALLKTARLIELALWYRPVAGGQTQTTGFVMLLLHCNSLKGLTAQTFGSLLWIVGEGQTRSEKYVQSNWLPRSAQWFVYCWVSWVISESSHLYVMPANP